MDLIGSIADEVEVSLDQATALAGAVLEIAREKLEEHACTADVRALDDAVPELDAWRDRARAALGLAPAGTGRGPKMLGGLLAGAHAGCNDLLERLGGEDGPQLAALVALAAMMGLPLERVMGAMPLALTFLRQRLPSDWVDRALAVTPLLSKDATSGPEAGTLGALSGLLSAG